MKKQQATRQKENYKTHTLLRPQKRPKLILQNANARKREKEKDKRKRRYVIELLLALKERRQAYC